MLQSCKLFFFLNFTICDYFLQLVKTCFITVPSTCIKLQSCCPIFYRLISYIHQKWMQLQKCCEVHGILHGYPTMRHRTHATQDKADWEWEEYKCLITHPVKPFPAFKKSVLINSTNLVRFQMAARVVFLKWMSLVFLEGTAKKKQ